VVVMLLLATNYIPVVINHILMAFYTSAAPSHCKVIQAKLTRILSAVYSKKFSKQLHKIPIFSSKSPEISIMIYMALYIYLTIKNVNY
jgi:hypothetical protein